MKFENRTYSSGYVPDQKPEEHHYAAICDRPVSTDQSTMILKFPETFADKSSERVDTAIYQQLDGEGASIYQQLHSGPKFQEALPQKNNKGNAASIYQLLNNDAKSSEA